MVVRLLTPKRQNWAANRNVILRGSALRVPITVANRYDKRIQSLITDMVEITRYEIIKLFKSDDSRKFFAEDASLASKARILINRIRKYFSSESSSLSKNSSEKMIEEVDNANIIGLKSSLQKLSGGHAISTDIYTGKFNDIVKATIAENVGLINSIPEQFLDQVEGTVMRSITNPASGGLKEVIENLDLMLDDRSKQIRNKAKNLALDQTRKFHNNIAFERMKKVGINKFEWIHPGGGQRPRYLHKYVLNGNIFSFYNLPVIDEKTGERGIPGKAINCGCSMLPVIEFNKGS